MLSQGVKSNGKCRLLEITDVLIFLQNMPSSFDLSMQVIAVPAHFNQVQQNATLKAAELAGLKEVQLLQGMTSNAFSL